MNTKNVAAVTIQVVTNILLTNAIILQVEQHGPRAAEEKN